ncbi:MAG: HAMP domain-containing protein [Magnetococcales bacterium]|nr:HAMP domain-containing protein [Magnetococcales bacterium]
MNLFHFVSRSIGRKILAVVSVLGTLSLLIMGGMSIRHLEQTLLEQNEELNNRLQDTVAKGLHAIMIAGYADVAQNYAASIKKVHGLEAFHILRSNGLEAFQDNKTIEEVNRRKGEEIFLPRESESRVEIVPASDANLQEVVNRQKTVSFRQVDPASDEAFSVYLTPIVNDKKCATCHGSTQPVRGVLLLKTSQKPVEARIAQARATSLAILVLSVATFLLLLSLFLRRALIQPLSMVRQAIATIAEGQLTQTVSPAGAHPDEMGQIGNYVNRMASSLATTIRQGILESQNLFTCVREFVEVRDKLDSASSSTSAIAENVFKLNQVISKEIGDIREAVGDATIQMNVVSSAANKLSKNIATMAQGALSNSAHIETVANRAVQTSEEIGAVHRSLDQVNQSVAHVVESAAVMDATFGTVRALSEQALTASLTATTTTEEACRSIDRLGQSVAQIGKISGVINKIAEKTRMLAINTAIEAARAGEAGKGFHSVSLEVKELAAQTRDSVQTISGMIEKIQADTAHVIDDIKNITDVITSVGAVGENITKAVDDQYRITLDIINAVSEVQKESRAVLSRAQEIDESSRQVSSAMAEAANRNGEIATLTAESARHANEIARRSQAMQDFILHILDTVKNTDSIASVVKENMRDTHGLTLNLRGLSIAFSIVVDMVRHVSQAMETAQGDLKVGTPLFDLELCKGDDFKWVIRLQELLSGFRQPAEIQRSGHELCEFGQWLSSRGPRSGVEPGFLEELRLRHQQLHAVIDQIIALVASGRLEEARQGFDSFIPLLLEWFSSLDILARQQWQAS